MRIAAFASFAVAFLFMNTGQDFCRAADLPVQVRSAFRFDLRVPMSRAAPLFGPEGERCWAGEQWDPQFVYPRPAKDAEGAVFTVRHGPHTSIWVTTRFDLEQGRMQYVSLTPDVVATTIDVRLTDLEHGGTQVEVIYTRTALSAAMNEHVRDLAANHGDDGPAWQKAIEGCLVGKNQ